MGTPEGWRMVPQRQKAVAQLAKLRHRQCFLQDVIVDGNDPANHLVSMNIFTMSTGDRRIWVRKHVFLRD